MTDLFSGYLKKIKNSGGNLIMRQRNNRFGMEYKLVDSHVGIKLNTHYDFF